MSCPGDVTNFGTAVQVINTVIGKIDQQMSTSEAVTAQALQAIDAITFVLSDLDISLDALVLEDPNVTVDTTLNASEPSTQIAGFARSPEPQAPLPGGTLIPEFPDAPDLSIEEVPIDLNITKPLALMVSVPAEPATMEVVLPDMPAFTLPDVPALAAVSTPDIPTLALPIFSAVLDDVPMSPDPTFSYSETAYSSDLIDELRSWLSIWVAGAATGIDPDVERSIWDRGRDREAATFGQAANQIFDTMAGRGFPMPTGAMSIMVGDAAQKMRMQVSSFNRDVSIKQAELEQTNRQFAFAKAWEVEQGLVTYASQRAQRSFDAAKYAVEAAIEVYKAVVLRYNAQVEAFKARAEVFKAQLQGELAKLEVFKSQIDAARLGVELDKAQIDLYRARIEGVKALISVYEGQLSAAKVQAEVIRATIEAYKGKVDAYKAQVEAKGEEYQAYESQIKAEVSKIEIVKARADTLTARANAYASTIRGKVDMTTIEADINERIPLDRFRAQVQAYGVSVQASTAEVEASARQAQTQVEAYRAITSAQVGMSGVQAQELDARTRQAIGFAEAASRHAQAQADIAIKQVGERIEAVRAAAQLLSTLAAGAMAGINVHAGGNGSASYGESQSRSFSQNNSCTTSGD